MVGNTMFPAFSRLRDAPEQLFEMVTNVVNVTCLVSFSMGIGLLVCAPAYIPIILSEKWLPAIVPLQILAVFGVLRAIVAAFTPVYKAVGRPDLVWKTNLVRLVTLAPALYIATRYGLHAVAATHVVAAAPFLAIHLVLLSRALNVPLSRLFGSVLQQAIAIPVVVGALILVLAPGYPDFVARDPIGRLVLSIAACAVYWVVVVAWSPRLRNLARVGASLAMSGRLMRTGV
jgi:PST family polysaccharide transporter/lipopolysaccharide exporter